MQPRNVLIYTVHKAASRFLTRLTNRVARQLQMEYHSIAADENFDAVFQQSWREFIQQGDKRGCFGPIRFGAAEPSVPEDLGRYSIIVHLRDPRDVLTSLFFSHVYSHGTRRFDPGEKAKQDIERAGIDAYVLSRAEHFKSRYDVFCTELLGREGVTFVKYEDMVINYDSWLKQFLAGFQDWAGPRRSAPQQPDAKPRPPTLDRLHRVFFKKFKDEFTVLDEDVHRHKRQILSGDHRRKLKPDTIELLNQEFCDILPQLGYVTHAPAGTGPNVAAA